MDVVGSVGTVVTIDHKRQKNGDFLPRQSDKVASGERKNLDRTVYIQKTNAHTSANDGQSDC
jgi:hypothetical protein